MTETLTIAVAQINPTVGDVTGNTGIIRHYRARAAADGADLVVFPELALAGYPPEDLVLKPAFQDACRRSIEDLARDTADGGPAMLVGTPWVEDGKLYNAAVLLEAGEVSTVRYKVDLPNYSVFDEKRVFDAGPMPGPVSFRGVRLGVMICEDMWTGDVAECLEETGAEILIVPNGSPFEKDKMDERLSLAVARVTETGLPLLYANQVGGQDELAFDGCSFVLNGDRSLAAQLPAWQEGLAITRWTRTDASWTCAKGSITGHESGREAIYQAMVLGLRDYVNKNRFPGVILGLSGGIDSALSAAVAVDALGADRVHTVMMPSRYTSADSLEDATLCADYLGCRLDSVDIEPVIAGFTEGLGPLFKDREPDLTEENIQSRARGVILMALSNKFGAMVLTTGNKSEMSVGYATLYGDMCGGFSVLKDLYKLEVFAVSRWRNENKPAGALGPDGLVMPDRVITKPPTAELRADQKDEDSLPPYAVLDDILECLVEKEMRARDVIARGHEAATVRRIEHLLYVAEYKRRQAPPGVKLSRRNFGRDRRYPITNGFRDAASG